MGSTGRKKIGAWLPYRKSMTGVSYENPGALVEEVRNELVSRLRGAPDVEIVEFEDFRKGIICSSRPVIEEKLDAFVWFGEIGGDFRREYNLEILKSISQRTTVINNPSGYETAMDKYLTGTFLMRHGLPAPRFMLMNPDNAEQCVREIEKWGGPVLLKPRLGSYGVGIMKIDRPADLTDAIDYMPRGVHYIEQMVPNEPEKWIGINIIGGEHAYSYRKGPESFHDGWKVMDRKRVGGKMILAQPSREQLEIAKKIANLLDMSWVGVDIITDSSGNPYVIDVNAFPGLYPEMFAKAEVSGAMMMAKAVLSRIRVQI